MDTHFNATIVIPLADDVAENAIWSATITINSTLETTGYEDEWAALLDAEFSAIVPQHWLQYPPPTKAAHITLGILYILILIPAIIGNWAIIWLFLTTKSLRTPSNVLVTNLAVADFLMNAKMPVFVVNSFAGRPVTGIWGCQLYGFLGGLSGTAAILSITAMSTERYVTISRPFDPRSRMTLAKATGAAIFIWSYSATFSILPFFTSSNGYVPEGYLTSCSFDYLTKNRWTRIFVYSFFVAAYCLPLITILFCYLGILLAVHRSEALFRTDSGKHNPVTAKTKAVRRTEIRLAKIAFTLIMLWLISWTPYAIVALIGVAYDKTFLTPLVSMVPALFCKSASVLDPYIYGLSHPRFKTELKKRFRWLVCIKARSRDQETMAATTLKAGVHGLSSVSSASETSSAVDTNTRHGSNKKLKLAQIAKLRNLSSKRRASTSTGKPMLGEMRKNRDSIATTTSLSLCEIARPAIKTNHQTAQTQTTELKAENSEITIKELRVYFIPRTFDIVKNDDKIKITFRQSL